MVPLLQRHEPPVCARRGGTRARSRTPWRGYGDGDGRAPTTATRRLTRAGRYLVPGPVSRAVTRSRTPASLWAPVAPARGLTIVTTLPQTSNRDWRCWRHGLHECRDRCGTPPVSRGARPHRRTVQQRRVAVRSRRRRRRPGYVRFSATADRAKWPPDLARVLEASTRPLYYGAGNRRLRRRRSAGGDVLVRHECGGWALGRGLLPVARARGAAPAPGPACRAAQVRTRLRACSLAGRSRRGAPVDAAGRAPREVAVWVLAVVAAAVAPRRWIGVASHGRVTARRGCDGGGGCRSSCRYGDRDERVDRPLLQRRAGGT